MAATPLSYFNKQRFSSKCKASPQYDPTDIGQKTGVCHTIKTRASMHPCEKKIPIIPTGCEGHDIR